MTIEEWLPLMQGVLMGLVLPIDWVVRRLKRPERHRVDPAESHIPPHIGGYRTSPRPQAMVPRRATWWRRVMWRLRGGPDRVKVARVRRMLAKEHPNDGWPLLQRGAETIATIAEIVSAATIADAEANARDKRRDGYG